MATPEKTYVARDTFAVLTRYQDAYKVSNAVISSGNSTKSFGIVLMLLSVLAGLTAFMVLQGNGSLGVLRDLGVVGTFALVFMGLVVGYFIYIRGLLTAALGQATQAVLDNAVSNSPFLTNDHRAKIFSLPGMADVQFHQETASTPASS